MSDNVEIKNPQNLNLKSEGYNVSASRLAETIRHSKLDDAEKRMKYIKEKLDSMDEQQLTRFEFFMRSHFSKSEVVRLLQESLKKVADPALGDGKSASSSNVVTEEMGIVAGSLAKLFVGEVMETAIQVLKESGEYKEGMNVRKEHIKEAYRRLREEGKVQIATDADVSRPFRNARLLRKRKAGIDDVF